MSDAAALQARLVGALFVERGLLTPDQLEEALVIQAATGELLGEVLITEFGVSRVELASVLAEQWAELEKEEAPPGDETELDDGDSPERRRIGEIFIERGFITQSELDHALEVQPGSGRPLGEVLIDLGSLSRMELASALAEQWSGLEKLRRPAPKPVEPWQQAAPAAHAAAAAQGVAHPKPEQPAPEARDPELEAAVAALGERIAAVEAAAGGDRGAAELRASIAGLAGRVETVEASIPGAAPGAEELAELRTMLAELQQRIAAPEERLAAFERRLEELVDDDGMSERLAAVEAHAAQAPWAEELAELRDLVEARLAETPWSGELAELRAALAGLETRPDERLASLESRLQELAAAERRLETRAVEQPVLDGIVERLASVEAVVAETPWSGELAELRAALAELEDRPDERLASLELRLQELAAAERRLETRAVEHSALDGFADRLGAIEARVAETPWQQEIEDLRERLAEESRGHADLTTVNELRGELGRLRRSTAESDTAAASRFDVLSARLDELARRTDELAAAEVAGASTVDAALQEVRVIGEERAAAATAALAASESKLRGRLDALAADVARGEDVEAVAARIDAANDALDARVTAAEEAVRAARDAMSASIADVGTHLRSDLAGAAERLRLLEDAAARMAESRPVGAAELEAALDATEARLADRAAAHDEATAVLRRRLEEIAAADGVLADRLHAVETDLAARLEAAGAALADRLHGVETDLGARLESVSAALARQAATAGDAAAAADMRLCAIESSLASLPHPATVLGPELAEVRARIDAVEVAAAAAAKASAGWSVAAEAFDARVTVVEAAQFSRDAVVEPRLAALERRLEEEVSQAAERARTVDRALRKGLASLGERLVDSEAAYVEAGNALRASIERLGYAVADADVRVAVRETDETDRARFDTGAYVAFVPTTDGYRLAAVDAALPAVGDIVEIEGRGCLRVSRIGASPIPLDTRACAYLEAPDDTPASSDA